VSADRLAGVSPVHDVPGAFVTTVTEAYARRQGPRFTVMLSGGPTAKECYEALAADGASIDWHVVDVYMGDERVVPADDPDANQRLVRESLIDPVGGVGSFVPMPTDGDPVDCAARYQAVISSLLAGAGIDLIHLGMGPDGHTASLFPGAPTLDAPPGEYVAATEDPKGHNPHPRLTVTLSVINAARLAVFTVAGDTKREAVAALVAGRDIPAARVAAATVRWLIDSAAFGPIGAAR